MFYIHVYFYFMMFATISFITCAHYLLIIIIFKNNTIKSIIIFVRYIFFMMLSNVFYFIIFCILCIIYHIQHANILLSPSYCTCYVILTSLFQHIQTLVYRLPRKKTHHNQSYISSSQQICFHCKFFYQMISFIYFLSFQ